MISAILRRNKISKITDLEPPKLPNLYNKGHEANLVYIDIKRLVHYENKVMVLLVIVPKTAKAGYEYLHVEIDLPTRVGFAQIFQDQSKHFTVKFLYSRSQVFSSTWN